MDFDPLSLFTPRDEDEKLQSHDEDSMYLSGYPTSEFSKDLEESDSDADAHTEPLHILEFPLLQLKPTAEVLLVLLKLLSPDQLVNFSPELNEDVELTGDELFKSKNLSNLEVTASLEWLEPNCPRFSTLKKLAYIPKLSESLKVNYQSEYNSYLTKIISNDLSWIGESQIEIINKEACLRLSENCGRNAQPDRVRKINIPNLVPYLEEKYVLLMEPSLTSDNLGLKTWGSSLILSNRLAKKPDYIVGEVLELGSGTGLVGMVSAILGNKTTLTDLNEITPNLQYNLDLNKIESEVSELDWCDPTSFVERFGDVAFNTILISDPIYSPQHPYWVVNMINKFVKEDGRILIQLPLRPSFEKERSVLWGLFEKHGYEKLEEEIEDGFDDFGEMRFCFRWYQRKPEDVTNDLSNELGP